MTQPTPPSATYTVTVPGASVLAPVASAALEKVARSYAEAVFEEASRYEVLQRANPSGPPEFTSRHIFDADDAVRRRFTLPTATTASRMRIAGNVALYAFAAGVGVGGNQLDEKWGLVLFAASLVAGLFTVALLELNRGGAS